MLPPRLPLLPLKPWSKAFGAHSRRDLQSGLGPAPQGEADDAGSLKGPAAEPRPAGGQGGGRSFEGTPLDSGEGPDPATSPGAGRKTGGVGQKVRAS